MTARGGTVKATIALGQLRRLAARVRSRKAERDARKALAMPARHPEQLTRELPEAEEEWLAGVAAELWPDDEFTEIITDTRREDW